MALGETLKSLSKLLRSTRGKNAMIFVLFLGVSAMLWFVMSINDEFQREIDIPVELVDIPDSVTMLSPSPIAISASVKDKGTSLIRYQWGTIPALKLRYKDFTVSGNRMVMGENQLISVLRSYFGSTSQIVSAKPDSISIQFTTRPGKRLPLKLMARAEADPTCVINGELSSSVDSVLVYSIDELPRDMQSVSTFENRYDGLTDTTRVMVKVRVPAGMRAVPDVVEVTIPVEPLISKTQRVPIDVENVPAGQSVVTFPSMVDITYLIPMSIYNRDNYEIRVKADYNSIAQNPTSDKIPLERPTLPSIYQSPILGLDSVEYVIEQK